MNKLLIINKTQFGYHIGTFNYCKYLKNSFNVTYVCLDKGKDKIKEDGVNVIYISSNGNFLSRGFGFVNFCYQYIKNNNFDLVFLVYLQTASILQLLLPKQKFILDIRTGAVTSSQIKNYLLDFFMVLESKAFKHITILSESLMRKLKFNTKHCHILPLGSNKLSTATRDYSKLSLLYVGTLTNRNIDETIEGFFTFINKYKIDVTYDIFGDGFGNEIAELQKLIKDKKLENNIVLHGRKAHDEIKPYFDKCTVGISYIPMTPYYDCQPPTKTFEYIIAGLLCIGTMTQENKKLININNGILCRDNATSFSDALEELYHSKENYSYEKVSNSLKEYTWQNIVDANLRPYIDRIIKS